MVYPMFRVFWPWRCLHVFLLHIATMPLRAVLFDKFHRFRRSSWHINGPPHSRPSSLSKAILCRFHLDLWFIGSVCVTLARHQAVLGPLPHTCPCRTKNSTMACRASKLSMYDRLQFHSDLRSLRAMCRLWSETGCGR